MHDEVHNVYMNGVNAYEALPSTRSILKGIYSCRVTDQGIL